MSLDVSLISHKKVTIECLCCGLTHKDYATLYESNITHNLNVMAKEAGIYQELWRPEELDITTAKQLIEPLTIGLKKLKDNPVYYKQFDAPNGWGIYDHFVPFVEHYLDACISNKEAIINVSR